MTDHAQTYTNLKIWDGIADDYLTGANTIRTEGSRIASIEFTDSLLKSDRVTDLAGLTVIPGLIDAHIHLSVDPEARSLAALNQDGEASLDSMAARAGNMVAAGITTARDLGGGQWLEVELRERIKRGQVIGPRLLCAGQPITSPGGHCYFWGGEAASIDEIKRVIDRQIEHGVDLIKVMATGGTLTPNTDPASAQFDIPTLEAIVSYAARQGCQVAAHCHGAEGIRNASEAGVSTVEHCSWIGPKGWGTGFAADVAARMATKGIWVSTTLNSGWKRHMGHQREELMRANYAQMRSAGVNLVASTDAGIPNVYHDKLPEALPVFSHFTGLSTIETLKAATSDSARAIGLGDVTGSIRAGLEADLLFVKGDPLRNLETVCQPVAVLARGVPVLDFPAPVR